jgi:hypothetical protein
MLHGKVDNMGEGKVKKYIMAPYTYAIFPTIYGKDHAYILSIRGYLYKVIEHKSAIQAR